MRPTRRTFLLGGTATVASALVVAPLAADGIALRTRDAIARVFGPQIASHPATDAFVRAFSASLAPGEGGIPSHFREVGLVLDAVGRRLLPSEDAWFDDVVTQRFALSTTVVLHAERGDPLDFLGLWNPSVHACSNPLSALMAA
jgi:hypothetical protein